MKQKGFLVVLVLLVIAFALPAHAINTLAKASGQGNELFDESISQPWPSPLNPMFAEAANKYNVPIELLFTLANFGSGFENRGSVPNIGGGYGVMGLTDNIVGGETLREAAALTGIAYNTLILDPAASIDGAAALLDSYAIKMGINRSAGIGAWVKPVYKFAGLDDYPSQVFVYEVFHKLSAGMNMVNSSGEQFAFAPMSLGSLNLSTLRPKKDSGAACKTTANVSIMSTEYGPATWYPAATCNYSTTTNNKDTVVVHTIEGSASGCLSWFRNCDAQVTSQYVVAESGAVYQCVLETQTAWHAGCYNARSVGIEHEGYAASPSHPQALYDASALLTRHLCDRFGIQRAKTTVGPGIIGHIDVTNCCCGTHTDPGAGWNWSYYISQVIGQINPPYNFDADSQGWYAGNSSTAPVWTNCCGWPGIIYPDQTGNDCWIYGPNTNFVGSANQVITVNVYPQNGSTASHDMQVFFKTNAENTWTADKSSPIVNYTAQNSWAVVTLNMNNAKWTGQTINQLRLDFDQTNHGNRWIVDYIRLGTAGPAAPASAPVGAVTASSIVWNWGNVANEQGFRLYDAASGGTLKGSTAVDVLTLTEGTLAANTSYTRYICAYDANGESTRTTLPVTVTLSVPPTTSTITCDKPVTTPQTSPTFTFTAVGGFGAGKVSSYKYVWDQSTTHTWTGSEATWNTGTNVCNATVNGSYYLHVKGYNSAGVENGTLDMGPYVYSAVPSAPASAVVGTITTTSIVWNWGNVTNESGFRLYDAATGGTQKGSTAADVLTLSEGSMVANTSYTRYACAYNAVGESTRTTLPITVTLSVPPTTSTVTCDKPVSTPQTTPIFTFTAVGGFGAGTVSSYKYVWDQSATHTWTGSEATWNTGTLVCTATVNGNWYLHVRGYNSAGAANGSLDMGPYVYNGIVPDIIIDNTAGVANGTWATVAGGYGTDFRYKSTAPGAYQTFTWTPTIVTPGNYAVYAYWMSGSNRSSVAPYTISYNGGSQVVTVNQTLNGSVFNLLGTFNFAAGTGGFIRLGADAPSGYIVIADAIKLVKQ